MKLYEKGSTKGSRRNKTRSDTYNSERNYPRKNARKKVKDHLGLTQWIETLSPTPGVKAPDMSPVHALNQLPSGGYLAQTWTMEKGHNRKPKHRVSDHTKRRINKKEEQLQEWNERSDLSDAAIGGGGPPDDLSSSDSSDSSSSEPTSVDDDNNGTNDAHSESDDTSESTDDESDRNS